MEKVYVLCYQYANELEDIRVCLSFDVAIEQLTKRKKTHQVLEYLVIDGISQDTPIFAYMFKNDELVSIPT